MKYPWPEPYRRAICLDKFGTRDETSLDLVQLHQLRITLAARAGARSRTALQEVSTP